MFSNKSFTGVCHRTILTAIAILTLFLASRSASGAAILIEEGGRKVKRQNAAQGVSSASHDRLAKMADDALSLRQVRRAGIGAQVAGPLGVAGITLELNFTPEHSFVGGYGGGVGYQAFNLQYKHVLGVSESVLPYAAAGFARWSGVGQSSPLASNTAPSFLRERFLNERERQTGAFNVHLIYPALGVQFIQSKGPWAGSSFFIEALLLADLDDFIVAPTGTLGYVYYF